MVKGVLFDMDGTMLDTEKISADCWKQAAKDIGYTIDDTIMDTLYGKNLESIKRLLQESLHIEEDAQTIIDGRGAYYRQYLREHAVAKKKGLMELLSYLKENNIPKVVCTSTEKETAILALENAGIKECFDGYVFGDMVTRGKPDPQGFQMAAELIGQKSEECLVVEDSINGVLAGKAAGGYIIFIPDIVTLPEEVEEGINAKMTSLDEIIGWLEKENGYVRSRGKEVTGNY